MDEQQRERLLSELAGAIVERRLSTPTRLLLDIVEPLGFLASQAALFVRPLVPRGRWHDYVAALEDETGWRVLQRMVDQQDC